MIGLLAEDEARRVITDRIMSRDWWVIPWVTPASGDFSLLLEQRHYAGEASVDFELIATPYPVSLARKSRCSLANLAELLSEWGHERKPTEFWLGFLGDRDILALFAELEDAPMAEAGMIAFLSWVMKGNTR